MHNVLVKLKTTFTKYKKPILKSLIFVGYFAMLVFLFILVVNLNVLEITNDKIFSVNNFNDLSNDYDCILILGAGVRADGSATPMLRDRLLTGLETQQKNKEIPIFLTGDSENINYTETVTMKNFLIENGVIESNIICDGYGLSTYESLWRAKNVYGYNKILIISQKYHLHRAVYIAEKLGIEAYGIDGALTKYGKQPYYTLRECFARVKDVFYSEALPLPQYTEVWREANE